MAKSTTFGNGEKNSGGYMEFDVISFGTATYDVFLRSEGMQIEGQNGEKDICFRYGAKLEVNEIYFDYGGGGTNSAVTFARQGLKIASVVQVGDDTFGYLIAENLKREKINNHFIQIEENSFTDYSTILWAPDGGRTILTYRGKTRLEAKNIWWKKMQACWFYISSLEGNMEIVKNLAGTGKFISWNPGGRELEQKEEILSLLSKVTVLNVNKEEMGELLNVQLPISNDQLLKKAQELPCKYIVITDDRRGAYLWDKQNSVWWHSGIFEDSPRYETTGAGDAFGSGFISGLIRGKSLDDCLYLASANASSVVAQVGAKEGILRPEDLLKWPKEKLKIERFPTQ